MFMTIRFATTILAATLAAAPASAQEQEVSRALAAVDRAAMVMDATAARLLVAAGGPYKLRDQRDGDRDQRDREKEEREQDARERDKERAERDKERTERQRDQESSVFERAYDQMDSGKWDRAVDGFSQVVAMKGSRADGALYWKAYSQDRLGQRTEALATIAELTKAYPKSPYVRQAQALDLEVRRKAGQPVNPDSQNDEDLKLLALNALLNSDPEKAIPYLEKVLQGPSSPKLRSQAVFVLSQSNSPRARQILKDLARGSSTPELQNKAIQSLGVMGGPESRAILAEVYASSTDVDVKRRILRAFMVAGERQRLFAAAQTEQNEDLRREAVQQLGVMGAHDELWQLYQKESSVAVKKQILQAMFVGGNSTRLIDLAKSEKDPELRATAVRNLGLMGGSETGDALLSIYSTDKDPSVRKNVINALFTQGNATALVSLARKETDLDMKKAIVQKLSVMGGKVATDYMLELLNK
jgi:HEAT repeat protein